tara:strand:- start:4005 stop:5243 length:1239 start_codon:yes stop_codon:yes gene_type:complete
MEIDMNWEEIIKGRQRSLTRLMPVKDILVEMIRDNIEDYSPSFTLKDIINNLPELKRRLKEEAPKYNVSQIKIGQYITHRAEQNLRQSISSIIKNSDLPFNIKGGDVKVVTFVRNDGIEKARKLPRVLPLGKLLTEAIETYLPNLPDVFDNSDLRGDEFIKHFKDLCTNRYPNYKAHISRWFQNRAMNFITQFSKAYIISGELPVEITYKNVKGSSTLGQPVYRKTDLTKSNKVEKSKRSLARKLGFGKILVEAIETYLPNLPDTFSNLDLQHEDFHRHFKELILNYHSNDNGRISSWFNYKVEGFISQFTKRYIESSNLPINVTYRKRDTPIYTKTDIVKSDWRGILQKKSKARRKKGSKRAKKKKSKAKKDACYYKVRRRYKKWPSAYASGALVQCRKKGSKNWGNSKKK